MQKKIEVATTDKRQFVKDILELGALGASLPETAGCFGGIILRTTVEVDEEVVVPQRPSIRVLPITKKERQEYIAKQAEQVVIPDSNQDTTPKKGRKAKSE